MSARSSSPVGHDVGVLAVVGPDMRRLKRVGRVAAGDGASARVRPDQGIPELHLALNRDDVLPDALAGLDIVEGVRYMSTG